MTIPYPPEAPPVKNMSPNASRENEALEVNIWCINFWIMALYPMILDKCKRTILNLSFCHFHDFQDTTCNL